MAGARDTGPAGRHGPRGPGAAGTQGGRPAGVPPVLTTSPPPPLGRALLAPGSRPRGCRARGVALVLPPGNPTCTWGAPGVIPREAPAALDLREREGRTDERLHRGHQAAHRPHRGRCQRGDGPAHQPRLAQAASIIPLGGKTLYLDLRDVSFMDSSGLNVLVRLRRRMRAEGGRLAVTGLGSQPTRLLKITDTYDLFTTDAAAVGNGARPPA
ncbi:STAS domain-containing protein [Streptomyces sp. KD18]|uniref:STAS domain-containing protein n=1 Tax=Streptomyces sp. KD18 TaxID=2773452 RepID=UPI001676D87E|nr:STAS domain-containing protein [Streptomyces sp. KD18]MBD3579244.1 STAS domain-containing protein [Streptomyces sp. KD18]